MDTNTVSQTRAQELSDKLVKLRLDEVDAKQEAERAWRVYANAQSKLEPLRKEWHRHNETARNINAQIIAVLEAIADGGVA